MWASSCERYDSHAPDTVFFVPGGTNTTIMDLPAAIKIRFPGYSHSWNHQQPLLAIPIQNLRKTRLYVS